MGALDRFETWMQRLLEGGLTGLLGGHVQPVDLARKLADHMDDHRLIGAGRTYAPNHYRILLAPRTMAAFATFQTALEDELAAYVSALAAENGYHLVGSVKVRLMTDSDLGREQIRLESGVLDPSVGGDHDGHTQAMPIGAAPESPAVTPLDLQIDQRRVPLVGPGPISVGRALDNDVIFDDASVSRHHARIVARGRHWMVEDLTSTAGCYVNSRRVSASLVRSGDLIRFGNVVARVEDAGAGT